MPKINWLGVGLAAVVFSACSFEDIFAKLATSNVEMGAKEEYTQGKIQEQKIAKINNLKNQYPEVAELKNVSESTNYIAWAFRKVEGSKTKIAVEAMLSNPGKQIYEIWVRGGKDAKEKIRLGAMEYNQIDDYSFVIDSEKVLTGYDTIMITREIVPDDKPETVVMTGAFVASASAQKK